MNDGCDLGLSFFFFAVFVVVFARNVACCLRMDDVEALSGVADAAEKDARMKEAEEGKKQSDGGGDRSEEVVRWEAFLPRMVVRVLLVEADRSTRQIITALLRKCSYAGSFFFSFLFFSNFLSVFLVQSFFFFFSGLFMVFFFLDNVYGIEFAFTLLSVELSNCRGCSNRI